MDGPDRIHPRTKMRWRNIGHVLDTFPKNKAAITAKEIYLDLEKRGKPLKFRTVRSILNQLLDEQRIVISKRGIQNNPNTDEWETKGKKSVSFYKINSVDAVFFEGQDVTPVKMMTSEGEITCMMETELVELIEETGRKEGKTFDEVMIERIRLGMTLYEAGKLDGAL